MFSHRRSWRERVGDPKRNEVSVCRELQVNLCNILVKEDFTFIIKFPIGNGLIFTPMFDVLSNGVDVLWHHLGMFKTVVASLLLFRVHLKQRFFASLPIYPLSNHMRNRRPRCNRLRTT
ncbi:hypothetical protein AVEN_44946-1 [Araneus ventricosus]|uniref:Uncharacterized protein n=1 Tax=Araneus ventricosus TaxID=182803 RepID=A0A4Y2SES8_ARAVE|nr:hypothetical protein AVEN_44946-1 [Araneus ventricosus]